MGRVRKVIKREVIRGTDIIFVFRGVYGIYIVEDLSRF